MPRPEVTCVRILAACAFLQAAGALAASDLVVVRDTAAPAYVRFAAFDLARHLRLATGQDVPEVAPDDARAAAAKRRFEVGTAWAAEQAGTNRLASLGMNGWAVVSRPGATAFAGVGRFGAAYGVYEFLEKRLGCRWYTPFDPPVVPKAGDLAALDDFELVGCPDLRHRWIHSLDKCASGVRDGALFELRNKLNVLGGGEFRNIDKPADCGPLTTDLTIVRCCHTLFALVPPHGKEAYFEKHPDWFSFVRDESGGRRVDDRQLCFSNPGLRQELAKNLLATVGDGDLVYSVSAEDVGDRLCECDRCLELERRFGTRGAPMFAFLANVSKLVAKRNPRAFVSTLAYRKGQAQVPPNAAFPPFDDNVLILFAPLDNDISKDMEHPNNRESYADFAGWCRKATNVWTWYYPVPYFDYSPFGGALRFAKDLRLMHAVGMTGACYEHVIGLECGTGFYDMYAWMLLKLFSDVDLDPKALMREFCGFAYGAAAERMYRYALELEDVREAHGTYTFGRQSMASCYTPERLVRWTRAFDEMDALTAADPRARQRVREARFGLDLRVLSNYDRIRTADPAFAAAHAPSEICAKGTNAVAAAFVRRGRYRGYVGEREHLLARYEDFSLVAGSLDSLALPALKDVPQEDVRQSFRSDPVMGCRERPTPGAALGRAVWDDEEPPHPDGAFPWCIYDDGEERYLARGTLTARDAKEGTFSLVRLGRVTVGRRCSVVLGKRWALKYRLNEFHEPDGDNEWDVYVSVKMEGPQYFGGSPDAASRVSFDRLVLVRPDAKVGDR